LKPAAPLPAAWEPEDRGYFTLSEERKGIPAFLYFYPRFEP